MKKTTSCTVALLSAAILACGAATARTETVASPASALAQGQAAQVHRAEVAPALYELAYSEKRNAVFVISAGGWGEAAPKSKVFKLNAQTLAVQAEVELPFRSFGATLDDAADTLYIGTSESSVTAFDTAALRVKGTLQLGTEKKKDDDGDAYHVHSLRELLLDKAHERLYIPGLDWSGSVLFVVDTRSFTLVKTIPDLGIMATGVALDGQRGRVFVSNMEGDVVTVNARTLEIDQVWDIGVEQPLNLEYDAATNRLFAVDQDLKKMAGFQRENIKDFRERGPGNRIAVRDADGGRVIADIPAGKGPVALKLDLPRQRLYVTNREAGTISVFDSSSYQLLDTIELPTHPNSLALDAKRNVLFASVKNGREDPRGNQESVVRIQF